MANAKEMIGPRGTEAEQAITREIESVQRRAAEMWRGLEQEATIELVRALDMVALSRLRRNSGKATDHTRETPDIYLLAGAATALRPFLSAIKGKGGGVPWMPSPPDWHKFAISYLSCCGQLAHLRRLAALGRYGLSSTSISDSGRIIIQTSWGGHELAALEALNGMKSSDPEPLPGGESPKRHWQRISRRMRSYVEAESGWFIRYDNDIRIVSSYRREAQSYASRYFEGEAFPSDVRIGDRTFGEWKVACDQALGRVLCHIDFATILQQKRPELELRNVLTIFARREDVAAVWAESGLKPDQLDSTMSALSLSIDTLDDWDNCCEAPMSFYIDLGKDFVLLPCFGALSNPYFALFRHLRSSYYSDWARGVDRREDVFRIDIAKRFAEPRYIVPANGFQLRRADGSKLTDIDAVICDRRSGTLALVQLKWHDVFGRSLTERESRRKNIAKANEWIGRVLAWAGGRSSAELASALGLRCESCNRPPVLYVIARYVAGFSGEHRQDPRAAWLGWPEIERAITECEDDDPLTKIPEYVAARRSELSNGPDVQEEFRFPGLTVELRVSP